MTLGRRLQDGHLMSTSLPASGLIVFQKERYCEHLLAKKFWMIYKELMADTGGLR